MSSGGTYKNNIISSVLQEGLTVGDIGLLTNRVCSVDRAGTEMFGHSLFGDRPLTDSRPPIIRP